MSAIEIMLKEYETLRQESLASMSNRNSILSFGLATIGAIFVASIASSAKSDYSRLSTLALLFAVPAISGFILFMWLGEYQRMQRAGRFLAQLEKKINEAAGVDKLLTWETDLKHMKYPYYMTVVLLTIISIMSFGFGVETLARPTECKWIIFIAGALGYLIVFVLGASVIAKLHTPSKEIARSVSKSTTRTRKV